MKTTIRSRRSRSTKRGGRLRRRLLSAWHLPFATLLQQLAPSEFEVQVEVWLSLDPLRADILILRRGKNGENAAPMPDGSLFRRLWPLLGTHTILEFKSPVRSSFRRGDLVRLIGYGASYHSRHAKNLANPDELTLVLVVTRVTPCLIGEMERMGFTMEDLGGGYSRVHGVMYSCYIVVLDDVCQEERSDFLRAFTHRQVDDARVKSWISYWMKENPMRRIRRPTRAEARQMWKEFISVHPECRQLDDLTPKELMEQISQESLFLSLPLDILRGLSPSYVQTLPEGIQRQIQERLGQEKPRRRRSSASRQLAPTKPDLEPDPEKEHWKQVDETILGKLFDDLTRKTRKTRTIH